MPLIFVLLIMLSFGAVAAELDVQFETYTIADGLPSDRVYDVVQDKQGFMWFGTNAGLTRYDGYEFKTYSHNPNDPYSLAGNFVSVLFIDSNERMWVGTLGGGISRFDPVAERFIHYPHQAKDSGFKNISFIAEGPSGDMWVGSGAGLSRLNVDTSNYIRYARKRSQNGYDWIETLKFDDLGRLWIGSRGGGISVLNLKDESFSDVGVNNSLPSNYVQDLHFDHQDRLWIATKNGLSRLDNWRDFPEQTPKFSHYFHQSDNPSSINGNQIGVIFEDSSEQLWFATNEGLELWQAKQQFYRFDASKIKHFTKSGEYIHQIFEDRQRQLWFATEEGVTKLNRQVQLFKPTFDLKNNLTNKKIDFSDFGQVRAFYQQSNGDFWLGFEKGLVKQSLSGELSIFNHNVDDQNSLTNSHLHAIAIDK